MTQWSSLIHPTVANLLLFYNAYPFWTLNSYDKGIFSLNEEQCEASKLVLRVAGFEGTHCTSLTGLKGGVPCSTFTYVPCTLVALEEASQMHH